MFARGKRRQGEPRQASSTGGLLPDDVLLRLEKRSLASQRTLGGGLPGEHRGRRLSSSLEFSDYRPYTPGDDFRRIDWNAYARLNSLLVKIPEAREDLTVHLLLDVSRSMEWGQPPKLRYAQQVCGGIGYMALCRLDAVQVGLLAGSTAVRSPRFRGKAQTPQLFRFLQHVSPAAETDLNAAMGGYLTAQFKPTDVAILVSDLLWPQGVEQGMLRLLRAGLRVVVVHLLSMEEHEPNYVGDLEMLDVENGAVVEVSATNDTLRRYRTELERWLGEIRALCRARGVLYLPTRSDRPIEQTLLGDFRHAGLLK